MSSEVSSRVSVGLLYRRLRRAFGPQHWWPAESPFEVMVGAILTQATQWQNVEQAIDHLRQGRALTPQCLLKLPLAQLQRLIRPVGYFRQKAKRIRVFTRWYLSRYGADSARMFKTPWTKLRRELLALWGIGPETADSILLYAGNQPVFVVDAYTHRVFRRHRLIRFKRQSNYEAIQHLVMQRLPRQAVVYNEFHALLVGVGKRFCHKQHPDCEHCPLEDLPRSLTEEDQ